MNADDHADIVWFEQLGRGDVARVGGKNASLGEMVRNLGEKSVSVPPGFATTADAYWRFLDSNGLRDIISSALADLASGKASLAET
jgi:pyruvate,water dikinase